MFACLLLPPEAKISPLIAPEPRGSAAVFFVHGNHLQKKFTIMHERSTSNMITPLTNIALSLAVVFLETFVRRMRHALVTIDTIMGLCVVQTLLRQQCYSKATGLSVET